MHREKARSEDASGGAMSEDAQVRCSRLSHEEVFVFKKPDKFSSPLQLSLSLNYNCYNNNNNKKKINNSNKYVLLISKITKLQRLWRSSDQEYSNTYYLCLLLYSEMNYKCNKTV